MSDSLLYDESPLSKLDYVSLADISGEFVVKLECVLKIDDLDESDSLLMWLNSSDLIMFLASGRTVRLR